MRKWIDIINEKWLNTIKAWDQDVDLFINPTRSEWAKLFHDYPAGLRGHILANGDLVVWDAMHASHGDVAPHLGSIKSGYRYFYPTHILFNDLNMDINEDEIENEHGEIPRYDWFVSSTYKSTVQNPSVQAFYGSDPKIIGADHDVSPSEFPITAEWIAKNCLQRN